MQHTVEDISPVKKKIAVTVPANEVDAILDRTVRQYRSRVTLPGFRKGKAPMSMVEKRFTQDIYGDAASELVNGNIGEILRELDLEPLGNLTFEGNDTPITRGEDFFYSFSFELMPQMTLPEYEGIGVEEDEAVVDEAEIDEVITRVRRGMAERVDVTEKRSPEDGDIATLDFAGFDENGEPVEGVSGEKFQVSIGDNQVIPDFEALVKTIVPGESGEGPVRFPNDYGHEPLAGKTVTMKITVTALQTRTLPEVDEAFAKKAGGFESVQAMRDNIRDTYTRNRKEMAKAKAQSLLLESLLEKTDFPLPEGLVARYTDNILHGRLEELSRQGKDMASLAEDDFETMRAEAETEAGKYAKTQLFLLTVAKKENIEASGQEMAAALRQIAARSGQDFKEMQEHYARNNLYPALRDRILADKAMDVLYAKAAPAVADEPRQDNAEPADAAKPETDAPGNSTENVSE